MSESRDESNKYIVVSDQAATEDSLGFTPYVIAIAEFLTSPDTKPPLTLSIEGEWGSGKSSFMKQLEQEIKQKSQELREEELKNIEKNALKWEKDKIGKWRDKELPYFFPSYFFHVECLKFQFKLKRLKLKLKQNTQTIEFNAWRHDKAESLWAAFALSFLEQISKNRNFPDLFYNLCSHLKLLYSRFRSQGKWVNFIQPFFKILLIGSLLIAIPLIIKKEYPKKFDRWAEQVVCFLSTEESTDAGENQEQDCQSNDLTLIIALLIGGGAGSLTGISKLLIMIRDLIGDPKIELTQYLESPDYDKQVAFIEKFHDDFKKIVDAYTGKDEKVYVFIDDLDRCELGKSADLLQALNLMISNDPNIIFILGMDREKVAAAITFKQQDVLPYLDSISGDNQESEQENYQLMKKLDYGFNFMEKFIQLTFSVPKPSEKTLEDFLKKLSSVETKETLTQDVSPAIRQKEPAIYPIIGKDLNQSDLENLVKMVAPFLDYNPRRLKQYINVLKLRIYITYYSIGVPFKERNSLTIEQLGKFVAITLKYPRLLLHLGDDNELLGKLEKYALSQSSLLNKAHDSQIWLPTNNPRTDNEKNVEHWVNKDPQLKDLLCYQATEKKYKYSLAENKGIKKLLEVSSELALDPRFFKLRDLLAKEELKKADEETEKIIFDENRVPKISCEDLLSINKLWQTSSGNKFGFTCQKEIYFGIYTNCQSLFDMAKKKFGLGDRTSDSPIPNGYYPFGELLEKDVNVWELGLNKFAKRFVDCEIFQYFNNVDCGIFDFTEDLGNGVELEMVAIPDGQFMMGSPESERHTESEGHNSEKPQHKVTVQPFYMGKYPITQAQWKAVASLPKIERDLEPNPSSFKGDDLPVENVSWSDAVEFCQRLSQRTGKEYRLPTEAEWEYAARAGTNTAYYFGNDITDKLANYNFDIGQTTVVGKYQPNAFGLYNMHGNVQEWCQDDWHQNYEGALEDGSTWLNKDNVDSMHSNRTLAKQSSLRKMIQNLIDSLLKKRAKLESSSRKVVRSGSWYDDPVYCRSAFRDGFGCDVRSFNIGFRALCVASSVT